MNPSHIYCVILALSRKIQLQCTRLLAYFPVEMDNNSRLRYRFIPCVFVCASAYNFGAFKLLTFWPIFVKLGMSVTTVENTWSQYF
jgi:hypothetical protein